MLTVWPHQAAFEEEVEYTYIYSSSICIQYVYKKLNTFLKPVRYYSKWKVRPDDDFIIYSTKQFLNHEIDFKEN